MTITGLHTIHLFTGHGMTTHRMNADRQPSHNFANIMLGSADVYA